MTTQINLKFQDNFFELAKRYADSKGYLSIQELVREALREKIFDDIEINEEYKKILKSKDANTFNSVDQSKKFIDSMKEKLANERV